MLETKANNFIKSLSLTSESTERQVHNQLNIQNSPQSTTICDDGESNRKWISMENKPRPSIRRYVPCQDVLYRRIIINRFGWKCLLYASLWESLFLADKNGSVLFKSSPTSQDIKDEEFNGHSIFINGNVTNHHSSIHPAL